MMLLKGDDGDCDAGMGGRHRLLISPYAQTGWGENFSSAPVLPGTPMGDYGGFEGISQCLFFPTLSAKICSVGCNRSDYRRVQAMDGCSTLRSGCSDHTTPE